MKPGLLRTDLPESEADQTVQPMSHRAITVQPLTSAASTFSTNRNISSSYPCISPQRENLASGHSVVLPSFCPKELGPQYLGCEKHVMKAKLNKFSKGSNSFAKFTSQIPYVVTCI